MTRTTIRGVLTLALLVSTSCMKPNPLAETADGGESDSDSGKEPGDGDGDASDGNAGPDDQDAESGDGDGDPEPGDGDGDPGDGDPGDGDPGDGDPGDGDPSPLPDLGGEGQSCTPLEWFDDECATCLTDTCCPAATLCAEAEGCECLAACKLAGKSPGACKNECGSKPEDVPEVGLLVACANASCFGSC